MKKQFFYLLLPMLACIVASCGNDLDPEDAGNHRYPHQKGTPKVYTVRLGFGGDYIREEDEPLLRADETEGDTYVAINVYRTNNEDENDTEKIYAYGIYKYDPTTFDCDNTNISVKLIGGYTYKFEASILTENTDHIALYNGSLAEPFYIKYDEGFDKSTSAYDTSLLGEMIYDVEGKLSQLGSGSVWIKNLGETSITNKAAAYLYPRVKRFYGVLDNYNPDVIESDVPNTGETETRETSSEEVDSDIEDTEDPGESGEDDETSVAEKDVVIDMYYKCFGIKFLIEAIPSGSYLTVEDYTFGKMNVNQLLENFNKMLVFPSDLKLGIGVGEKQEWEDVYSMNSFSESASKTFKLRFTWHYGSNAQTKTFTKSIEVTPMMKKVLKISVTGDTSSQGAGNIKFNLNGDNLDDNEKEEEVKKDF